MAEGLPQFTVEMSASAAGGPAGKSPDRIDGIDGEQWAKWLIKDKVELNSITSPDLKMEIRLLARDPDSVVNSTALYDSYQRINKMIREGKAETADAVSWQVRISDRHQRLVEAESTGRKQELIEAQRQVLSEREPSLQTAVREFMRAERLGNYYEIKHHEQIVDRIKDENERRLFGTEVKIFNAALIKRFQGGGSMKGMGEFNSALKTLSTPELVDLMQNMPGYLGAMQEIADIVVNRKTYEFGKGKDKFKMSLLDCRSENQFLTFTEKLDEIIKKQLVKGERSETEAEFLAQRAVSTAINTMFCFNVFEYYNSFWTTKDGKVRLKYKECAETAPPDKQGTTLYDRLVSKLMVDAMCPLDDFLNIAFKKEGKEPTPDPLVRWAKTEMAKSGVEKIEDFDMVVVLGYSESDVKNYWTLQKQEYDGQERKILFIPPVRPTRLGGSLLNVSEVKLVGKSPDDKEPFIKALAEKMKIDFRDINLGSNAASIYTIDAPDLDVLKGVLRGDQPKTLADIMKALGTFGQGKNMELITWIYIGVTGAMLSGSRQPKLNEDVVYNTNFTREIMGLPETDKFNLLGYLKGLPEESKIRWTY